VANTVGQVQGHCRWAEHTGGKDCDDTDLNDETDGVSSHEQQVRGQFSNEVLDEFEVSAVYHMIDEV